MTDDSRLCARRPTQDAATGGSGRGRRRVGPIGALCAILTSMLALAGDGRADRPVPHRQIPDIEEDEALMTVLRARGQADAVIHQGVVIEAPRPAGAISGGPGAQAGEALGDRRETGFRPDRTTALEGELAYFASFDPTIAPFKRVTSFDQVALAADGRTPVLRVADPSRRPVVVDGSPAPAAAPRDRFWGEVTLDFSSSEVLPLASVAPDSRVLALRSTPPTGLVVERDQAGNYAIRVRGRRPNHAIHLAFLLDAPRAYFGAEIPDGSPVTALADRVPPLPPTVAARALAFARSLGLGRDGLLRPTLHTLVGYFRAFEESREPPADTGDILEDLLYGGKGLCRHRAYGFVIVAQALGIPARFVQNEAHSFAEVEVPEQGFLRIDLGGAARGLTARGADDRVAYQPRVPDPFPRPAAYLESRAAAPPQLASAEPGPRGQAVSEHAAATGRWLPPGEPGRETATGQGPKAAASARTTGLGQDERMSTRLILDQRSYRVVRGRSLTIEGRLLGDRGQGLPDMRIELSLAQPGRRERLLLGLTATGEGGEFHAQVGVPGTLAPGTYRLVALCPGDDVHRPAIAP